MKDLEFSQHFSHYNPMDAICCHGNKRYSRWNLILIGQLVSEIFKFEKVNRRTHERTHGRTHGRTSTLVPSYWLIGSLRLRRAKIVCVRPMSATRCQGWLSEEGCHLHFSTIPPFDLIYTSQLYVEFDLLLCFVVNFNYTQQKKFRKLCLKGSNKTSKTFEEIWTFLQYYNVSIFL